VLLALVAGLAVINQAGVYAQLVAVHVGERGAATAHLEEQTADLDAKIDVQVHTVAELDRRVSQIEPAIEEAARAGQDGCSPLSYATRRKPARGSMVWVPSQSLHGVGRYGSDSPFERRIRETNYG
jgi:hypothetical protein